VSELLFKAKQVGKTLDNLWTPKQTSERIRIGEPTLAVWRSTRRYNLPYVKIGSRVFYRESDVEKFLSSRTMSGISEPPPLRARRTR
jgi:Helix-turn-helix domain